MALAAAPVEEAAEPDDKLFMTTQKEPREATAAPTPDPTSAPTPAPSVSPSSSPTMWAPSNGIPNGAWVAWPNGGNEGGAFNNNMYMGGYTRVFGSDGSTMIRGTEHPMCVDPCDDEIVDSARLLRATLCRGRVPTAHRAPLRLVPVPARGAC